MAVSYDIRKMTSSLRHPEAIPLTWITDFIVLKNFIMLSIRSYLILIHEGKINHIAS